MRILTLIVITATAQLVLAQTPTNDDPAVIEGWEIVSEADRRDRGWNNSRGAMQMTLINRNGKRMTRELRNFTLEVLDEGDKSLSVFDTPRDLAGASVLTWSRWIDPDSQWVFLPATKRVKRINSRNKAGAFMGSEFAYEDIASQEPQKYTHKLVGEEACGESLRCYIIERRPNYKYSGYIRQLVWIDQTHYRNQRVEYYDRKGELLKTLRFLDYELFNKRFWRARLLRMENQQSGRQTELSWLELEFDVGLTDADFRQATLTRPRK